MTMTTASSTLALSLFSAFLSLFSFIFYYERLLKSHYHANFRQYTLQASSPITRGTPRPPLLIYNSFRSLLPRSFFVTDIVASLSRFSSALPLIYCSMHTRFMIVYQSALVIAELQGVVVIMATSSRSSCSVHLGIDNELGNRPQTGVELLETVIPEASPVFLFIVPLP